jgi:hypothetical protein
MYRANIVTGPKCINANTGMGTIQWKSFFYARGQICPFVLLPGIFARPFSGRIIFCTIDHRQTGLKKLALVQLFLRR